MPGRSGKKYFPGAPNFFEKKFSKKNFKKKISKKIFKKNFKKNFQKKISKTFFRIRNQILWLIK